MIPYKEYTVHREAERRVLTTSKSTLGEEENWNEEPPLPPREIPPGAKSMAPSQEDEWKLMVDQDPHSGSAAASTPVQTLEEDKAVSLLKSPLAKKPCFQESITKHLLKTAPTQLKPNHNDAELVRYTQPSLVNVIPWIKYEAQNMLEPSFRQELQCIKEVKHLQYIIVMIMWFQHWR